MFYYEDQAKDKGFDLIVGIDEAGRGPLAGPVVAAAVCLKTRMFENKISDSKKLTPNLREKAFHEILQNSYVGVGIMNEQVVDAVNILEATFLAMTAAVFHLVRHLPLSKNTSHLMLKKICLLIDGNSFKSELPYTYKTIINGDNLSCSIACASIVAKVTRDRILSVYDRIYPEYDFKSHKGYPTQNHRKAIQQYGLSMIHRHSFKTSFA